MKLIKLKIKRDQTSEKTSYTYPTPYYDARKVKYGPIYEGGLNEVVESDIKPRGNKDEFIIIGVADVDFDGFMQADGYERSGFTYSAIEVDKIKTVEKGNKWTGPQIEKITDQAAVTKILVKVAKKEKLTVEDEKVIDSNDPTPGIVKSKSFEEDLDEALNSN